MVVEGHQAEDHDVWADVSIVLSIHYRRPPDLGDLDLGLAEIDSHLCTLLPRVDMHLCAEERGDAWEMRGRRVGDAREMRGRRVGEGEDESHAEKGEGGGAKRVAGRGLCFRLG